MCRKEERKVQNDYVISYEKRLFQLSKYQRTIVKPKEIVTVSEDLKGEIKLSIRKVKLNFTEIEKRPAKPIV